MNIQLGSLQARFDRKLIVDVDKENPRQLMKEEMSKVTGADNLKGKGEGAANFSG